MTQWFFPTISETLMQEEALFQPQRSAAQQRLRAEREWAGAIAALNVMLHRDLEAAKESSNREEIKAWQNSVILSGPAPVLGQMELQAAIANWTFTATPLWNNTWMPFRLLPTSDHARISVNPQASTVPIMPNDPLGAEQFCWVITPTLRMVMVLGETAEGTSAFLYSFEPETLERAWQALRARLLFLGSSTKSSLLQEVEALIQPYAPQVPDYRRVAEFGQLMLALLPEAADLEEGARRVGDRRFDPRSNGDGGSQDGRSSPNGKTGIPANGPMDDAKGSPSSLEALTQNTESFDAELLQAIAHEVRTPLTTIRTLTRLLLKRKDLNPTVLKRLSAIDQECTEQIDRFNLIFRAVELEKDQNKPVPTTLAPISLTELFQQHVPRWQQLASQRSLSLDVRLPKKLPLVVTDPTMLDQVLTGLVDRITQTLPIESHIQVSVVLAGSQLKLQFQSDSKPTGSDTSRMAGCDRPVTPLKSLGQLLMFQPETGNLSLNLAATKNLFQALGGKLTVRQRPQQGEVLTIYLPLDTQKSEVVLESSNVWK